MSINGFCSKPDLCGHDVDAPPDVVDQLEELLEYPAAPREVQERGGPEPKFQRRLPCCAKCGLFLLITIAIGLICVIALWLLHYAGLISLRSGSHQRESSLGSRTAVMQSPWFKRANHRACRLNIDDTSADGQGTTISFVNTTLNSCKDRCELLASFCTGVDYSSLNSECDLWTQPIDYMPLVMGRQCFVLNVTAKPLKTCFEGLGERPGYAVVRQGQGKELGSVSYGSLWDCANGCEKEPDCQSFTACQDWRQCFLRSDRLTNNVENLTHVGHGCTSYRRIPCAEAKHSAGGSRRHSGKNVNMHDATSIGTTISQTPVTTTTIPTATTTITTITTTTNPKAGYVWNAWPHFDLPNIGDAGTADADDLASAKQKCERRSCSGFSVRGDTIFFKDMQGPLQKENLIFMGTGDHVVFYSFGPPVQFHWKPVKHYDFPGHDAEVVELSDIDMIKRYAEKKGYTGFSFNNGRARMKNTDKHIFKHYLKYMGKHDPVVFYLPMQSVPTQGATTFFEHDLPKRGRGECAKSGNDCRKTKCCDDPNDFCYSRDKEWATCRSSCSPGIQPGSGEIWSCEALGNVHVPGLSLYCFVVVHSSSSNFRTIQHQAFVGSGIAACDELSVFSERRAHVAHHFWSIPVVPFEITGFGRTVGPVTLQAAWRFLSEHYVWRVHDWVVKVDPETVFFPSALKAQLMTHAEGFHHVDKGHGVYLMTCVKTSDMRMTNALEVVSQKAMATFSFNENACSDLGTSTQHLNVSWLQQCMQSLGSIGSNIGEVVLDSDCDDLPKRIAPNQCKFDKIAFHPFRSVESWKECWEHAHDQATYAKVP